MTAVRISVFFQKTTRTLGVWVALAFLTVHFQALIAQNNLGFEAALSTKEIVAGVPFELTFTLKNAEGARFTAPTFPGFKTGGISEMRGMSFINGRSSSSQTWSLEVTAVNPGNYIIGPASVVVGGQTLRTKPLTVNVLSASSRSKTNVNVPPGADDKIFIAAEFDQKEAYVGQQVTWRIRLYTQLSVEGYDIISLPDFKGFFSKEKIRYDKRVEYVTLRKKKYAVRTLHEEALFPQESGELSLGAARISVGIEQPGAQGFLFGPKPVSLQTQPVTLQVKTLPADQPAEFTGGVGQYEWEITADTNSLTTDDALTLVLEVKGNGDTRRFGAPKIAVPPNCEIFEPRILEEEEYESETEILHRKRFEYVVLPKDTGMQEINPTLSYFDTDSNRYCLLRTQPIRFAVSAGKNYSSPGIAAELPPAAPVITQQPGLLERLGEWFSSALLWSALGVVVIALTIFLLFKRRKPAFQPAVVSRQEYRQTPNVQLPQTPEQVSPIAKPVYTESAQQRFLQVGQLLTNGDPKRFYNELFKSIQAWLATRFGLQPAQMNDADVSALLRQRGATPIRIQALLSVWHTCEQAIYGGQDQADQMESTWQMARQVIEALEREIR